MEPIEGKIAAILDKSTVVINKGAIDGVSRDDEFYLFTEIGPFTDPDTGKNLGITKKIWGRVTVTILEDLFCIAETGWTWRGESAFLTATRFREFFNERVQIELPVSETDIDDSWRENVRVGTRVVSLTQQESLPETKDVAILSDGSTESNVREDDEILDVVTQQKEENEIEDKDQHDKDQNK
jgi:hypothetical protein